MKKTVGRNYAENSKGNRSLKNVLSLRCGRTPWRVAWSWSQHSDSRQLVFAFSNCQGQAGGTLEDPREKDSRRGRTVEREGSLVRGEVRAWMREVCPWGAPVPHCVCVWGHVGVGCR